MSYTVRQLSTLAGISTRTLHYYDEIGLLKPETVGANRYRYYGDDSVQRLQQILFYRELDLPLENIKQIMGRRDFDALKALESHRRVLGQRVERLKALIQTVEDTILNLKGQKAMNKEQLFEAFSDEQQEEYAREAEQLYDPEIVRASNRRWKSYSAEERKRILEEGSQVYVDLLKVMDKGAESTEVQACVARWRKHMDHFWTPSLEQLAGLAEGYNSDPRFKANFDKIDPSLAGFMREAVKVYVARVK